jgi:hypothetical protein
MWAVELLSQVCKDEGRSKKPKVHWINSGHQFSGGNYNPRKNLIRIRMGQMGNDHKQVFLHEIAHWLTRPRGSMRKVFFWGEKIKRKNWHGKRFYKKLNELLIRYDCFTDEYKARELDYKPRAAIHLTGGEQL